MGICKYCGKYFFGASLGGHTTFCEMNPNREAYKDICRDHITKYNKSRIKKLGNTTCKCCGEIILESKKFCNSSCAAKYNNKKRAENGYTSKGKKKKVNCLQCGNEIEVNINCGKRSYFCKECRPKNSKRQILFKHTCIICGKEYFTPKILSNHCSHKCSMSDPDIRKKLSEAQLQHVKDGTHKGWATRNIRSYPEKFFKKVLTNNSIEFKQEVYIPEFKYFLDFLINIGDNRIDLEIDGKQHKYEDRKDKDIERDKNLINTGYIIYRIDWNEINSDEGKILMKEKIDKFLEFIEQYK